MSAPDPSVGWQPIAIEARRGKRVLDVARLALGALFFVAFTLLARIYLVFGGPPGAIRGRWLALGARVELGLLGLSLDVEGKEALERPGPMIVVANHGSLLDVLLFGALLRPGARALLRREFARIPLLGPVLRRSGHILVDRDSARAAARGLDEAAQALARGEPVLIFPEGTRHPHGTLGRLRSGAFRLAIRAGVPIVPVTVLNGAALLPRGALAPRPGVVSVVVGEAIDTNGWSVATLDEHVRQVRDAIARPLARYRAEHAAGVRT